MYTTYFHQSFSEGGFEKVQDYYRRYDVLSYSTIFIPVHHSNHWFLITFDGKELVSFDPYNYPGANGWKKEQLLEENMQFHRNVLTNLKENYFKPLFKKYDKQWREIAMRVKFPPEIPAQENHHDCGVFLLTFAKYMIYKKNFDFGTDDMILMREMIRKEMESSQICNNISLTRSRKRKASQTKENISKLDRKVQVNLQRRIVNPDAETCWLNSCLQLVLTALDFKDKICSTGSVMWQNLLWLQGKDSSVVLDPTDVKQVIVQTERKRMLAQNIAPNHMLFDLGNLPMLNSNELRMNRIGQQDCKDFFFCIDENRDSWPDIFNLFKIQTLSETQCSSCGHTSRQEISGNERTFINLTCPTNYVNMKDFIEDQMNGFNVVKDWRDEDGCGNQVEGKSRTTISNIEDIEYVIFVLERLIRIDDRLEIITTKVKVNPEETLHLLDIKGTLGQFKPMAIIHHSGNVVGQTTQGHYRADVKNKDDHNWYRTSDNEPPQQLATNGLTNMGYIFLYKKSIQVEMYRGVDSNIPEAISTNEFNYFDEILKLLDEMNVDLVFHEFDDLTFSEEQWISNLVSGESNTQEFVRCINKLGKR
jgi:ubiquitin C-terminal hydrolase